MKELFSVLFFPGIIIHESSHVLGCALSGVIVYEKKLFGIKEAYVVHEKSGASETILINILPFLLGNLIGIIAINMGKNFFTTDLTISLILHWIGISSLVFSFPSKEDASNTIRSLKDHFAKKVLKLKLRSIIHALIFSLFYLPITLMLWFLSVFGSSNELRAIFVLVAFAFSYML